MCQNDEYTESEISLYTRQLMSALDWLHRNNKAHLDVKVVYLLLRQPMTRISNVLFKCLA